jgi:hypothetical protein
MSRRRHSLIRAGNSLIARKKSLFRKAGNLVGKLRKTQGKFGS